MQNSMSGAAKGGGGSFTQKPDTLRSNDTFEGLIGLCVGPIKGPVRGLKSIRVNGTPVEGEDGTLNFPDFTALYADGDPLKFPQVAELRLGAGGSPDSVGANIRNHADAGGNPWVTHTLNNTSANAIDLRFIVQQLYRQTAKGIYEDQLRLEIQMKPVGTLTWINPFGANGTAIPEYGNGMFEQSGRFGSVLALLSERAYNDNLERTSGSIEVSYLTIRGKTTSAYIHELRVQVPNSGAYANKAWDIRVRLLDRESYDSPEETKDKDRISERRMVQWESVTAVYNGALGDHEDWRGLAWLQVYGKASDNFNGLPTIDGIYDTKIVRVPPATVYDPLTRLYTGTIWDGSWAKSYCNDPAWVINDAISDSLSGIAAFVPGAHLNKWDALELSKWASELVPDGAGGMQPRYAMNLAIDQPQKADEFIRYLAGAVGATAWDSGDGEWRLKVDKPEAPSNIFTHENIEGEFLYSHTDVDTRFNDVTVVFNNEEFDFREDRVRVQDFADIDRNGRKPTRVVAIGCTNRQQALRLAILRLRSNLNERRMVTFQTNRQGKYLERFDHILIADGSLGAQVEGPGWRSTGRVIARQADGLSVTVRDAMRLELNAAYQLHFTVPNPAYNPEPTTAPSDPTWDQPTITVTRTIVNTAGQRGDVTQLFLNEAVPADMAENAVVALSAVGLPTLPRAYRVVDVGYDDDGERVTINAIEIDTGKWNAADNATETQIEIEKPSYTTPMPQAPGDGAMFHLDTYVTDGGERRVLTVRWERPIGRYTTTYNIRYRVNGGSWRLLDETANTMVEIHHPDAGSYDFEITANDRRGRVSQPLKGSFEVQDTLTIPPSAGLTNEAAVVSADANGNVASFASAVGAFFLNNSTGVISEGVSYYIKPGSATGGLVVTIDQLGNYATTSLASDEGSVTLVAEYLDFVIEKVFSVAKSRAGATGDQGNPGEQGPQGPTLTVTPNKTGFTYVAGVLNPASQTITFSAKLNGVASSAAWTTTPNIKSAASGSTFTISNTEMGANQQVVVTATVNGISVSQPLTKLADPVSTPNPVYKQPTAPTVVDGGIWYDGVEDLWMGRGANWERAGTIGARLGTNFRRASGSTLGDAQVITGEGIAAGFLNQGALATKSNVAWAADITGRPALSERLYDMNYATVAEAAVDIMGANYAPCSIIATNESGGKALKIGDNSGNDAVALTWSEWYSYSPTDLYEIIFEVEFGASATDAVFYAGVRAVDKAGNNLGQSYNYVAAQALGQNANVGRRVYKAYLKGYTTEAASHAPATINAPKGLPDGSAAGFGQGPAVKFAPVILANYPGQSGQVTVHNVSVRRLAGELSARPNIVLGDAFLRRADGATPVTEAAAITNLGTAAAIANQTAWATSTLPTARLNNLTDTGAFNSISNIAARDLNLLNGRSWTNLFRANGSTAITDADAITSQGVAAAISGQTAWATYTLTDPDTIRLRTQRMTATGALGSDWIFDPAAPSTYLSTVFPGEYGANKTETRTAAAIAGQGALAVKNAVDLATGDVLNKSLAVLDSAANAKLLSARQALAGALPAQFEVSNYSYSMGANPLSVWPNLADNPLPGSYDVDPSGRSVVVKGSNHQIGLIADLPISDGMIYEFVFEIEIVAETGGTSAWHYFRLLDQNFNLIGNIGATTAVSARNLVAGNRAMVRARIGKNVAAELVDLNITDPDVQFIRALPLLNRTSTGVSQNSTAQTRFFGIRGSVDFATNMPITRLTENGSTAVTLANFKTGLGVSAGFLNQGALSTKNTIAADTDLSGLLALRLQPASVDQSYLAAGRIAWAEGNTVEAFKPQEAGSNKTETRTAAAISNQGPGATAPANDVLNYKQENSTTFIPAPQGASNVLSSSGSTPGAIRIDLPVLWTNHMMRFQVEVFDFASHASVTYLIGGYNYTGAGSGGYWVNPFAQMIGRATRAKTVRFGSFNGKACVWIGDPTDTWSYVTVRVINFFTRGTAYSSFATGWSLALDTAAAGNANGFPAVPTIANPSAADAVFGSNTFETIGGVAATLTNFKTGLGISAGFVSQGALSTKNAVDLATSEVLNKSLANVDSAANTKLTGIEAGADVTATAQRTIVPQYPVIEVKEGEAGHTGDRTVTHAAKRGTATLTGGTWSLPSINVGAGSATINSSTGTVTLSGIVMSGAYTVRYTHTDGAVTDLPVNVTYVPAAAAGTASATSGSSSSSSGVGNNNNWTQVISLTLGNCPAGRLFFNKFGLSAGTRIAIASGTGSCSHAARLLINGTVVASVPAQPTMSGGAVEFFSADALFNDAYTVPAGTVTVAVELQRTTGTGTITVMNNKLDCNVIAS